MFGFFRKKIARIFVLMFDEETLRGFIFQKHANGRYTYVISDTLHLASGFSNEDAVLDDVDKLLDGIERKIGARVDEVMYVVPDMAVDRQKEVIDPYRAVIKSITKNLELQAIGYVQESELPQGNHISDKLKILLNEDEAITEESSEKTSPPQQERDSLSTQDEAGTQVDEYIGEASRIAAIHQGETILSDMHTSIEDDHGHREDFHDAHLQEEQEDTVVTNDEDLNSTPEAYYIGPFLINGDILMAGKSNISHDTVARDTSRSTDATKKSLRAYIYNFVASIVFHIRQRGIIMMIPLLLGGILLMSVIVDTLTHRATVHIAFAPQFKEAEVDIVIENLIKENITKTITFKTPTSGKKDVGTAARGEVQLYNFELSPKTFAAGTQLKTTSGIVFLTETSVTVAAAKQVGPNIQAGNVRTKLIASAIGNSGNIPVDTQLVVDGTPSSRYYAQTLQAFSGGSSKTARVVERIDITAARAGLDAQIQKVIAKYMPKAAGAVLSDLIEIETKNTTYSHDIDEESDYLEVRADVHIDFTIVAQDDITKNTLATLQKDIAQGFILDAKSLVSHIKNAVEKSDKINIVVQAKISLMPNIKTDDIYKGLVLAPVKNVPEIIKNTLQQAYPGLKVERISAQATSFFGIVQGYMPYLKQFITITYK